MRKLKLFSLIVCALFATQMWAVETFTMANIFTGSNQSATVTSPVNATVTTTATAGNAKDGKLGSDGNYFEIVLASGTFTAASINGYINTNNTEKNWGFQFTTNGGTTWATEVTQANDGTKSAHDITVGVTIPSGANGIRVIRRAGTSTYVYSISLTLAPTCTKPGTPGTPSVSSKTHNSANLTWTAAANSDGYKVSIVKKSDASVVVDWTDCATNSYAASGLSPETTYTFKVKAVGATGYCDLGDEASVDFATEVDPAATTYKVTLVPAGGTISDATGWTLNAGNYEKEVSDGTKLTLPTFTKVNHKFMTWRNNASVDVASPVTISKDTVLNAVWAEIGTYAYSYSDAKTISELNAEGWAFTNNGYGEDKATVDLVSTLNTNGRTAPKTNGMNDNALGYLKNAEACATLDLGQVATVTGITATLYGGSSSAFDQIITFVGADGSTVKKSYTNSLNAGNWNANSIVKSDEVADVRYIKVYGASKFVVMSAFSVSFIEFRKTVSFSANGGTGDMASKKYVAGATVTLPKCTFIAPAENKEFDTWACADSTITKGKFTMPASDVEVYPLWKIHETSDDATLKSLKINGTDISGFKADSFEYAYQIAYVDDLPVVTAEKNDAYATVEITDVTEVPGTATVLVTAEDGTTKLTYSIYFTRADALRTINEIFMTNKYLAYIPESNNPTNIYAYYLAGGEVATVDSVNRSAGAEWAVNENVLRVTGADSKYDEYTLNIAAVTPVEYTTNVIAFDSTNMNTVNAWVKAPYGFDMKKGGWKFSKTDDDYTREKAGKTHVELFLPACDTIVIAAGSEGTERNVNFYINGDQFGKTVKLAKTGDTLVVKQSSAFMLTIASAQTGGDGGVGSIRMARSIFTVTYNAGDGECATDNANVVNGAAATLPAVTPQEGYRFNGWFDAEGTKVGVAGDEVTITKDSTLYAQYSALYAITCATGLEHGTVEADKAQAIAGETVTLDVEPTSANYSISSVTMNGEAVTKNAGVYSFEMPAQNVTVSATFAEKDAAPIYWKLNEVVVTEAEVTYGSTPYALPTLDKPNSLTVALASSATDVAEFEGSTLNIKKAGTANISATYTATKDGDYRTTVVSYALTVKSGSGTALDNTADEIKAVKFFENGQLFIRRGEKVYTITGELVK